MTKNEKEDREGLFDERLRAGLRELDGVESAPDVSADVVRRLDETAPEERRGRSSWFVVVAALLAIGVTATFFVQDRLGRGAGPDDAVELQDPVGAWRLVYAVQVEERKGQPTVVGGADFGQALKLMEEIPRQLQARVGDEAVVTRGEEMRFVVTIADSSPQKVERVRGLVETGGRLEMRILADADYSAATGETGGAVRFDMQKERERLVAWLEAGGRELLRKDPMAIAQFRLENEHLGWYPHRIVPWEEHPDRWTSRYSDYPALRELVVPAHSEADWNDGEIPAAIQAKPAADRFLIELVPINLHETSFTSADLDPDSTAVVHDELGGPAVGYRIKAARTLEYADFSEKYLRKCCAIILDGEVLSVPMFQSRIPGVGRISGRFTEQQAKTLVAALRAPLPAKLRLLRSEPATSK